MYEMISRQYIFGYEENLEMTKCIKIKSLKELFSE